MWLPRYVGPTVEPEMGRRSSRTVVTRSPLVPLKRAHRCLTAPNSNSYVSRELCRAMGGDLVLDPTTVEHGSAMVILLPGEAPESFD